MSFYGKVCTEKTDVSSVDIAAFDMQKFETYFRYCQNFLAKTS